MTTDKFDPTTNRIPFGLLSEDEQTALIHWPHGWESYTLYDERWNKNKNPAWCEDVIYRGKLAPVVTSRWFNVYQSFTDNTPYASREKLDLISGKKRIAVLRIDTRNGVKTAYLENV